LQVREPQEWRLRTYGFNPEPICQNYLCFCVVAKQEQGQAGIIVNGCGSRAYSCESVIFMDVWPEMLNHRASVTLVGKPDPPFAGPDEHLAILHCRGLDFDISRQWNLFRHYD
jgi:hypothetical protein